jgi:hypothetical protein
MSARQARRSSSGAALPARSLHRRSTPRASTFARFIYTRPHPRLVLAASPPHVLWHSAAQAAEVFRNILLRPLAAEDAAYPERPGQPPARAPAPSRLIAPLRWRAACCPAQPWASHRDRRPVCARGIRPRAPRLAHPRAARGLRAPRGARPLRLHPRSRAAPTWARGTRRVRLVRGEGRGVST